MNLFSTVNLNGDEEIGKPCRSIGLPSAQWRQGCRQGHAGVHTGVESGMHAGVHAGVKAGVQTGVRSRCRQGFRHESKQGCRGSGMGAKVQGGAWEFWQGCRGGGMSPGVHECEQGRSLGRSLGLWIHERMEA